VRFVDLFLRLLILWVMAGHLRISDFGLAVILKKENDYKVTGGAGTPGYQGAAHASSFSFS
jgi:hypothetical protein